MSDERNDLIYVPEAPETSSPETSSPETTPEKIDTHSAEFMSKIGKATQFKPGNRAGAGHGPVLSTTLQRVLSGKLTAKKLEKLREDGIELPPDEQTNVRGVMERFVGRLFDDKENDVQRLGLMFNRLEGADVQPLVALNLSVSDMVNRDWDANAIVPPTGMGGEDGEA